MTAMPPMTQPSRAIGPAACAANSAPNSQPEPMMEVSDAQVAPINPISRLRPTSDGAVGVSRYGLSCHGSEPSFRSAYVGHTACE